MPPNDWPKYVIRDVNGDGARDLDPSRITYFGQSFGGIYGTTFLGAEPAVHAGVLNVPGGSITEIARLSPSFRPLVGIALATRVPSLYNAVPNATFTNFNENLPLSGQPIVVDTVPGADAIQNVLDQPAHLRVARVDGPVVADVFPVE